MTQLLLKLIVLQMRTTKIQLISYVFHVDTVSLDMFVNISNENGLRPSNLYYLEPIWFAHCPYC